jgi:hypothetical protein
MPHKNRDERLVWRRTYYERNREQCLAKMNERNRKKREERDRLISLGLLPPPVKRVRKVLTAEEKSRRNAEKYQRKKLTPQGRAEIKRGKLRTRQRKLAFVKDYKSSHPCEKCGEKHIACLQFHHKDPKTKSGDISAHTTKWGMPKLLEEIAKCIVLCANCHMKLHWEEKQSRG